MLMIIPKGILNNYTLTLNKMAILLRRRMMGKGRNLNEVSFSFGRSPYDEGNEILFLSGMTWNDFVNSEYNDGSWSAEDYLFYIEESEEGEENLVKYGDSTTPSDNWYVQHTTEASNTNADSIITPNGHYWIEGSGPDPDGGSPEEYSGEEE